jgi:hypothetical protein
MYIAVFKTDLVSLDVGVLSKLNPSNDIFTLSLFFSGLLSVVLARYSSAGLTKLVSFLHESSYSEHPRSLCKIPKYRFLCV